MSRYFERMQGVLESHGGTVEKFIGDAVMAVFGIPAVHEDDAVRAVRAAQEMRDALAELNADLEREWSVTLQTRIGVNTGPVVAGDPGAGQALVTGDAVNTAARLEQAAGPGEILIGEETFALARDAIDADPVDPLGAEGQGGASSTRTGCCRSGQGSPGTSAAWTPAMVGRDLQLRMLLDAFEAADDGAHACHLFTRVGAGGDREVAPGPGVRLLGRRPSAGALGTLPVLRRGHHLLADRRDGDPGRRHRRGRPARTGAGRAPRAARGHTGGRDRRRARRSGMLGPGRLGAGRAPWAVRRFLEALGRRRPLVAVFDDIHWAEPTLLEVDRTTWARGPAIVPILLRLHGAPRAPGGTTRLGRGPAQRDQRPPRTALRTRGGRADREPARAPGAHARDRANGSARPPTGTRCSSRRCCRCSSTTPSWYRRTASGSPRPTCRTCRSRRRSRPCSPRAWIDSPPRSGGSWRPRRSWARCSTARRCARSSPRRARDASRTTSAACC